MHSTLLGMWYIRSDWWKLTNSSDVMNKISHRVYQTGEGERGSEVAANDLGRLRIRLLALGLEMIYYTVNPLNQSKLAADTRQ